METNKSLTFFPPNSYIGRNEIIFASKLVPCLVATKISAIPAIKGRFNQQEQLIFKSVREVVPLDINNRQVQS
jgi:hypothetical protein